MVNLISFFNPLSESTHRRDARRNDGYVNLWLLIRHRNSLHGCTVMLMARDGCTPFFDRPSTRRSVTQGRYPFLIEDLSDF
jgi:hypothetical protein